MDNQTIIYYIIFSASLIFVLSAFYFIIFSQITNLAIFDTLAFIIYYIDYVKTIKKYIKNEDIKFVDEDIIKKEFINNKEDFVKKAKEFYEETKDEILPYEQIF